MKLKLVVFCISALIFGAVMVHAKSQPTYKYSPVDPSGFCVITSADDLPILDYLFEQYGVESVEEHPALLENVLAKVIYPSGETVFINNGSSKQGSIKLLQEDTYPPIANTCDGDEITSGFPYVITGADLPYQQTFDTTMATDTGDFRGSAADAISRPGGHDGYWLFTPGESGTYIFTNFATKGDFAPIPDHDFERGFGGIGVWSGNCGEEPTEIGTANSIIGDSILPVSLEAETTYLIVWEDFFVGSTENSVRLRIEFVGSPQGNTLNDSISLVDEGWNFEIVGDTTVNENLEDSSCVKPADEGTGHGPGVGDLTGSEIWYRLPAVTPGAEYTLNVLPSKEESPLVDTALVLHAYNVTTHQVAEMSCSNDISEENRLSSITFTAEKNLIYYVMVETVPSFDQPSFGRFLLQGLAQTSSVKNWTHY